MRFALALAALACLFPGSARAELVQAELMGHVTGIRAWDLRLVGPATSLKSFAGLSVGDTVEGSLRYDTHLTPGAFVRTSAGGNGLTLIANGMHLTPTDSFGGTVAGPQTSQWGNRPATLALANGLSKAPLGSTVLSLWAGLYASDPLGKLFGPSASEASLSYPGSAALAGYSPQGNASIYVVVLASDGPYTEHAEISIAVDSLAVRRAPEPSALVLFGLGGLGLLGLAPRRLAARLLR
jgi:hypothetical protein